MSAPQLLTVDRGARGMICIRCREFGRCPGRSRFATRRSSLEPPRPSRRARHRGCDAVNGCSGGRSLPRRGALNVGDHIASEPDRRVLALRHCKIVIAT